MRVGQAPCRCPGPPRQSFWTRLRIGDRRTSSRTMRLSDERSGSANTTSKAITAAPFSVSLSTSSRDDGARPRPLAVFGERLLVDIDDAHRRRRDCRRAASMPLIAVEGEIAQARQLRRIDGAQQQRVEQHEDGDDPRRAHIACGQTTNSCAFGGGPPAERHFTEGRRAKPNSAPCRSSDQTRRAATASTSSWLRWCCSAPWTPW